METQQRQTWHILQVDDDEDDYILTRVMLDQAQGRKISLDWACNYNEGLRLSTQQQYDAILVDYDLGSRTGIDLIRQLSQRGSTTPLVLFTGRGSYEVDLEASQAGATMYLTKDEANPLLFERVLRYAIERKQAQARLVESEERYQALAAATFEGIVISEAGRVLDANEQMGELFGYRLDEMVGQEISMFSAPEDRERILRNALSEREGLIEHTGLRKNGATFLVEAHAKMISYQNRRVRVTAVRDVSAQRRMMEALRESERRYSSLFNNYHTPMLLIDMESGAVVDANPAACQFYGWSRAEMTRKNITEINTLPLDELREKMALVRSSPGDRIFLFRHRLANGETRPVEVRSGPINIENREYVFSIVHDLSGMPGATLNP